MRPDRLGLATLSLATLLLVAGAGHRAGAAETAPAAAAPDSARAGGAASDSTRVHGAAPDSLSRARPGGLLPFRLLKPGETRGGVDSTAARSVQPVLAAAARIDLEEARKRAEESLGQALLGRLPVLLDRLPVFGEPLGSVRLPDGAATYRMEDPWPAADGATDRGLVRLGRFGGIAGLAATLDDPEGTGADVLDDGSLSRQAAPEPIRGPSDALAGLTSRGEADPLTTPGTPMPRRFRTTLVYEKGDGEEEVTGARFFSPTIGRGLMGAFSRHAAGGEGSISQSVSTRYRVAAGLPKWMNHTLSAEGRLFSRSVDMPLPDGAARAEMERGSLSLRATSRSRSGSDDVSLTLRRAKRTDIPRPGTPLERWEMPELNLKANATWGDSLGGSLLAGIDAASARVSYRTGEVPDFRRNIQSARVSLGARRPLGPGGVGADAAYDVTGRQTAQWDARVAAWLSARRAAARLDLESAVQRPTWIDLWTPYRADTIGTDTTTLFYTRAGNPSLKPRRQTGVVGHAALELGGGLRLEASGAAHRVTQDFGWTAEGISLAGPLYLSEQASLRGDGWISFASLSAAMRAGPLGAHAVGWVRGGTDGLTPEAGSPPRRALEVEADFRRALFGGDMLARLSISAHVLGPRDGLIREPAQVLWDGSLELDFGAAGAVLGYRNLSDRHIGSGVFDLETGQGEPLPGRAFHFGIVWNLLD